MRIIHLKPVLIAALIAFSLIAAANAAHAGEQAVDIAPVWAGHSVGFCLLTHPPYQYAAYYDADRRMTVASRKLDSTEWRFTVLPETIGWDSHNRIVMAMDDGGHLHLSGNMHVKPLVYFRTEKPCDISTFVRVEHMIGQNETRVTYPHFLRGAQNELLFTYRDGKSGEGNQIYNVYDLQSRTWRRLLDQPLTDGQGKMNAYFNGPIKGPDGYFHLCWVWRDNFGCESNHDLSYARSKDLVHWENSRGEAAALPITLETSEIVDPVPAGGGIINGNTKIGFDAQKRVVIAYHKYDEKGFTQIYNARSEEKGWRIYPSSDWEYRWAFSGGGTIPFEINLEPVRLTPSGDLIQGWNHKQYGNQTWRLDPATLRPLERVTASGKTTSAVPKELESDFPGMQVRTAPDLGASGEPGIRYCLRWETLGPNRDKPRDPPWPPPSMLRVYKIEEAQ